MKALGMYIFGGSQTIGHMESGFNVDQILEMTEDMTENNSYHFTKNYPNIPVLPPSEWNKPEYLQSLKEKHYDLLFANNPCSGLSTINKNASANSPTNNRFFEVFEVIKTLEPKVFLIENAPTLVTIGTPLLQRMTNELTNYKFTIIRDYAGNHNVPMKRMRTLIVGWNKNTFTAIPKIPSYKIKQISVGEVLKNLNSNTPNMEFEKSRLDPELSRFYHLVNGKETVLRAMARHFDEIKDELSERELRHVQSYIDRCNTKSNIWDKSAYRLSEDYIAPSMTSMAQFIHPTEHRDLYIREYARIMGYPDDFVFYPDECKCSTIQCLAQGVPVNFIKYISTQIHRILSGYRVGYSEDEKHIFDTADVVFQHHTHDKIYGFTHETFNKLQNLSKDCELIYKEAIDYERRENT